MSFRLEIILLLHEAYLSEGSTFPMKPYLGIQILVGWLLSKEGYNGAHTFRDMFEPEIGYTTKYSRIVRPMGQELETVDPGGTLSVVGPMGLAAMRDSGSDIDAILTDYLKTAPDSVKRLAAKIKSDIISSDKAVQSKAGSHG